MSLTISSTSRSTTQEIEERFLYRLLWRGRSLPRDLSSMKPSMMITSLHLSTLPPWRSSSSSDVIPLSSRLGLFPSFHSVE
ncbi:hypothetical protein YC2023_012938 [Brassica napus]